MIVNLEHLGDYLTFAAIGASVGLDLSIDACEVEPGVYRRYWGNFESRSSISRDGYLGVIHYSLYMNDIARLDRIIKVGMSRHWNMDTQPWKNAPSDYVNIWPLIPYIFAVRYKLPWLTRLIPLIAVGRYLTGFRSHLLAMGALLQLRMGVKSKLTIWSLRRLVKANPHNPLFKLLLYRLTNKRYHYNDVMQDATLAEGFDQVGCHGWGSCPPIIFNALCKFIHELDLDYMM